jgi:hypothetical protein
MFSTQARSRIDENCDTFLRAESPSRRDQSALQRKPEKLSHSPAHTGDFSRRRVREIDGIGHDANSRRRPTPLHKSLGLVFGQADDAMREGK